MEPTQFGNYTLIERISHGGMAEVFRAKSFGEAGFEREVALKVLLPQLASDQEFITMLIDEAKIAGQLNHTNIAQIFDLGVTDGRYFIVQEYVRGQDLRAILRHKAQTKTKLQIETACYIAFKVCEGLFYAHNKKDSTGNPLRVVHRDISPHNILISAEGEVKIIDFGIAKAEGRSTQTMAGLVKGKFAYMSPEQVRGLPVDHRSDIFATGILLYEMLTNRSLYRRGTEFETLKRARTAHADPPSILRAEVPPELDKIVLKALARHVHDRYQNADEFRNALWSFAREHDAYSGGGIVSVIRAGTKGDSSSEHTVQLEEEDAKLELASEVSAVDEIEEAVKSSRDVTTENRSGKRNSRNNNRMRNAATTINDDEDELESSTIVDPSFLHLPEDRRQLLPDGVERAMLDKVATQRQPGILVDVETDKMVRNVGTSPGEDTSESLTPITNRALPRSTLPQEERPTTAFDSPVSSVPEHDIEILSESEISDIHISVEVDFNNSAKKSTPVPRDTVPGVLNRTNIPVPQKRASSDSLPLLPSTGSVAKELPTPPIPAQDSIPLLFNKTESVRSHALPKPVNKRRSSSALELTRKSPKRMYSFLLAVLVLAFACAATGFLLFGS